MQDFHEYIDLARVFWALDDERIEAIAQSETASPVFRDIAAYVQELKGELKDRARVDKEMELAAVTKIAVRLAGIPDDELVGALSGLPKRESQQSRRRGWWGMIAGTFRGS